MALFGVEEFARRTGRSVFSIYRDVERGRLKHFRIGRHIRFNEAQFEEFLKRSEVAPTAAQVAAR